MELQLQNGTTTEVTIHETNGHLKTNTYIGDVIESMLFGRGNPYPKKVKITETWTTNTHQFNVSDKGNGNIHCAIVAGVLLYQDDRTGHEQSPLDEDSLVHLVSMHFEEKEN